GAVSDRPQADPARVLRPDAGDHLSRAGLARGQRQFFTHADRAPVAVVALWQLQRRDGGGADRVVPAFSRTAGVSLAYSLATALFGCFTPLISTWLIEQTSYKAVPGLWMGFGGACGLFATLTLYRGAASDPR